LSISESGDVRVVCERRQGGTVHRTSAGNSRIPCTPQGPQVGNGEVRVTVCVNATDGKAPVPDWLSTFGLSLRGRTISASSLTFVD
jgi:hypothetical protein